MERWVGTANQALRRVPVWPLYALALVPVPLYFWWALSGVWSDPVAELEHRYGKLALQFLLASLVVTPVLRIWRLNLIRFRRMLGLTAFYYLAAHLVVYGWLDRGLDAGLVAEDLTKRPYIILGFVGTLALIPPALTSTDWAVRRLPTRWWRRIHRLVYLAAAAGAVHYLWLVKSWPLEPVLYTAGTLLLLMWRVYPIGCQRSRTRQPSERFATMAAPGAAKGGR